MFNPRLILPHLRKIAVSAARNTNGLLLDANENRLDCSFIHQDLASFSDAQHRALRLQLSLIKAVSPNQIMVSAGGIIEPIDLIIRATCAPAIENVMALTPVSPEFARRAQIAHVQVIEVPLDEDRFQPDIERISQEANERTQIIYISSPNDQTGQIVSPEAIEIILANFEGLVIIDESYVNFSRFRGSMPLLSESPNLVILQSLNHAWGLAGLNLGICMAHPDLIAVLEAIRVPNSISNNTQTLAFQALKHVEETNGRTQQIIQLRESMMQKLITLPNVVRVFASEANFLTVEFSDIARVKRGLVREKIQVYQPESSLLANCLRFTVGSWDDNLKVLSTLQHI